MECPQSFVEIMSKLSSYVELCKFMNFFQSYAKVLKICQIMSKLWCFAKVMPKLQILPKLCQVMPKLSSFIELELCQSNGVIMNYAKARKFFSTNTKDSKFYMLKLWSYVEITKFCRTYPKDLKFCLSYAEVMKFCQKDFAICVTLWFSY